MTSSRWRSLLGDFAPDRGRPLALGIELHLRPHTDERRWRQSPAMPAHPRSLVRGEGELSLGIRPLTRSEATGGWIKGEVSWDVIRRPNPDFRDAHREWFADLLSICRDALLSGAAGEWIPLDHVSSPLLWAHLRTAHERGIPFVSAQQHTEIVWSEQAQVVPRLARDSRGALSLDAAVRLNGRDCEVDHVRPIGRSGLYTVSVQGTQVRVNLAEAPLSPMLRGLLGEGGRLTVPREEETSFFQEAYPALARAESLEAGEGMVLPELPDPRAEIAVHFDDDDALRFRWRWNYGRFGSFEWHDEPHVVRDPGSEAELAAQISELWRNATGEEFVPAGQRAELAAAEFTVEVLPLLERAGVKVARSGREKNYRELTGDPEVKITTVESTDPDWFDLGFLVTIDGNLIPFQPLFAALSTGQRKLKLVDGSYFSLAHPALDRLRDLLTEADALNEWETGPRINRYQTTLWEEFEDLADVSEPAVQWRELVEGLRDTGAVTKTPLPKGLRAELRPYQREGFDWLAFLWQHRLGGILADDMGLGKTLQLLTLLLHARQTGESRPFLVVAPTSVLGSWQSEAARFVPDLRVVVIDKTSKKRDAALEAMLAQADVIVTSYTLLRLDAEEFTAVEWAGAILDEGQFVKNPAAQGHRVIADLRTDVTIAVTGTPLENSLTDLWALLSLSAPGLFPSPRQFREDYVQPIEKGKVPANAEGSAYRAERLARLRRRIRPLVLRRTKELVAADLPPKQEQVLSVSLSPAHQARYDAILQRERQKVLGLLEDLDRNRFTLFRSLTLMRMASLAPVLVDPNDAQIGSRKLDVLVERVQQLREEGHRALVFSQFTSYLDLAAQRLSAAGIDHALLDGSTRQRQHVIDGFRDGDAPVFLISLKAGGFGLTLTEADYVFLLDPWWNPAAEEQAIDRTHRIGQDSQVFVYRLIAEGTIEEKVLALQRRKARLFTAVMDDDELFSRSLTADDIRALFER